MRRVEKFRRRIREARAARAVAAPRLELRRGGVYALPDGTELVAVPSTDGSYFLYHLSDEERLPDERHGPA